MLSLFFLLQVEYSPATPVIIYYFVTLQTGQVDPQVMDKNEDTVIEIEIIHLHTQIRPQDGFHSQC